MEADPLVKGVQRKLKSLARKLGRPLASDERAVVRALEMKERDAKAWWAKRDLADEYARVGLWDKAWRLYNQAIALRARDGGPCDTIYSHMARLLQKEDRHGEAIYHYLLARNELVKSGIDATVPKFVEQGVDRCLGRLKLEGWGHARLFETIGPYHEPEALRELLNSLLE